MATVKSGGWASLVGAARAQRVADRAEKDGSGMGLLIEAAIDRALADPAFVAPPKARRGDAQRLETEALRAEAEALRAELAALKAAG